MKKTELQIIEILTELKNDFGMLSLKSEFEDEGASFEETTLLKNFADEVKTELAVKIGGCSAIFDIQQTQKIGANSIIAPMIESEYALKKFIESVKSACLDIIPDLYINIETLTGYKFLQDIINSKYFDKVNGLVLGRTDMTESMGENPDFKDSDKMLKIAKEISNSVLSKNKQFIIGGGISSKSIDFLKSLNISKYETRKVIFHPDNLKTSGITAINKALEFEILWLNYIDENIHNLTSNQRQRLNVIKSRFVSQV